MYHIKQAVICSTSGQHFFFLFFFSFFLQEERSKVDDLRGTPMSVGTLEEIIDDNHAIVSTSVGSEHYVSILSFVDKDQLEPGCSVLLNHKVSSQLYLIVMYVLCFNSVMQYGLIFWGNSPPGYKNL
jgi:hypothetical protein